MRRFIVAAAMALLVCAAAVLARARMMLHSGEPPITSVFDTTRNASGNTVFSNNNLTVTSGTGATQPVAAYTTLFHPNGKFIFRMTENVCTTPGADACGVGLGSASSQSAANFYLGKDTTSVGLFDDGRIFIGNASIATPGVHFNPGDTIDVAADLDNQTIRYSVNGGAFTTAVSIPGLASYNLSPGVSLNAPTDAFTYDGTTVGTLAGYAVWNSPTPPGGNANCSAGTSTITVCGASSGVSTRWMGTQEDAQRSFHLSLLQDMGFNSYRDWNISTYLEPVDDTSYGALTPAAIKANPNVIPWATWDAAADTQMPRSIGVTQRQMLTQLLGAGITPFVELTPLYQNGPSWMPVYPDTTDNYNELWENCFAVAYWMNVRNNYGIDIYQLDNEPDIGMPNSSTLDQGQMFSYYTLCHDAINYVYTTFLGRTPIITAPVSSNGSGQGNTWVTSTYQNIPNSVDWYDYHTYAWGQPWGAEVNDQRTHLSASAPVMISEFGYLQGSGGNSGNPWTNPPEVAGLQNFLLHMSMPGSTHAVLWSFYEMTNNYSDNFALTINGNNTLMYYAMREFVRAMKGARPVYNSVSTNGNLTALTAFESGANVYHVFVQNSSSGAQTASVDLSQLISGNRSTTLYRYDSGNQDVSSAGPAVTSGATSFTVNGYGSVDLVVPQ